MGDYKTPGVYVEEKSLLPASVAGVSTAIPAFIGSTQKAGTNNELLGIPTKVTTLKEYEELFGAQIIDTNATTKIEVAVSAEGTISVTMPPVDQYMYYAMQMFFNNGGESCYIVAVGTGVTYENAIDALKQEDEPTLIVIPDAVQQSSHVTNLYTRVLQQCNTMKDRFAIFDVADSNDVAADATAFRSAIGVDALKYGAAYYPYLQTTIPYLYDDNGVNVTIAPSASSVTLSSLITTETELFNKIKKEIAKYTLTLPPSSAVAGKYASVDRDRGVWKAPANVSIASVVGPKTKIKESENDDLNVDATSGKSINVIKMFTGKGTLIWGARTLAGNDNEWRYIPVRRLFNYVEESIEKATSFAVFEPNVAMTWLKLRSMIESFLDGLWRQGALAGAKAEDAYFVDCGLGTTMTSNDILEGRLIIKVGIAAVRPAEFIILEFTHKLQES